MPKTKKEANAMPMSITELQPIVEEFVDKINNIDNEIALLTEDKKKLIDDYSEKLDVKTLKLALRMMKIKEQVTSKDTFDTLCEVLDRLV